MTRPPCPQRFARHVSVVLLSLSALAGAGLADGRTPPEEFRALAREQVPLYQDIHAHPELGFKETRTAGRIARELRSLGAEVTTGIGGTGVVGVLRNGEGRTVLVRTELDALPVVEETGLPYASRQTAVKFDGASERGQTVGLMHACGHDLHMANLIGTAKWLSSHRADWRGTIVFVAQPAEEGGSGAKAMIRGGLLSRLPKIDAAVAFHAASDLPTGVIGYRSGPALGGSNSAVITLKGRGGHGSRPNETVDPIVLAAAVIMDLQTIVSREMDPREPSVVTVGSIHGGTKGNIIPDSVQMKLTMRSTSESGLKRLGEAIVRHTRALALAHGAPEPEVKVSDKPYLPTINNPALVSRLVMALRATLGDGSVREDELSLGSEDFGDFGRAAGAPSVMLALGTVSQARLEDYRKRGEPVPTLHSSKYYPDAEPALTTGIQAMTTVVLTALKP